jgi:hypothetical protein
LYTVDGSIDPLCLTFLNYGGKARAREQLH